MDRGYKTKTKLGNEKFEIRLIKEAAIIPINCPLSGSTNLRLKKVIRLNEINRLYKDYDLSYLFMEVKEIRQFECLECGYEFYHPEINGDSKYYQHLSTRSYYRKEKWEFDKALNHIQINDDVLELGCGDGAFLEKVKSKCNSYIGIDINSEAIKVAKSKRLNVINCSFEEFEKSNNSKFDVICMFQLLEHIYSVNSFLTKSLSLLKKGGKLIICVPNNDSFIYTMNDINKFNLPPHHQGLWNKKSLTFLGYLYNLNIAKIYIEPLKPYVYSLYYSYLLRKTKDLNWRLAFILKKIPKVFVYNLMRLFGGLKTGHSILFIYSKN